MIALTSASIAIGILGVVAAKTRNCLAVVCFSALTILTFIGFILGGGILISSNVAANRQIDTYCSGNANYDAFTGRFTRFFKPVLQTMDSSS